jgi:predicted nucleic acid-binding protein
VIRVADSTASRVIVVDANILINFLHAGRLGLLTSLPGYQWIVPEDVASEITDAAQRQQIDAAVVDQQLRVETISEPSDLVQYADLRRTLGRGESACIVLAARFGWLVASDEKGKFLREVTARLGQGRVVNTAGLFVAAIRAGLITVEDADAAKSLLEKRRFRLPFASFRDVL